MNAEIPTAHPHFTRNPGICSGSPCIRNSRLTVRHIAQMWKDGASADMIVEAHPHLQLFWVYDPISYYLDHQQEIEQETEDNCIENRLAKNGGSMDEKGEIHFPQEHAMDGQSFRLDAAVPG